MGKSNIQICIEKQRAAYETMPRPLLSQLAQLHGISVRNFASIFEISKSNAEQILNHKRPPSLELAFKIARYFECTCDDLFGWMFDDDGQRRPLLVEVNGKAIRLKVRGKNHGALPLVREVAESLREMEGSK